MSEVWPRFKDFLKFFSFSSFSIIFFFNKQLFKIALIIKFPLRFKILLKFLSKKIKFFLLSIKLLFNISAYPHIISLLGSVRSKLISEITKSG